MNSKNTIIAGITLACGIILPVSHSQESTEELVKRLQGSAGAQSSSGGIKTRGATRSLTGPANAPAAPSETRSVLFRGIPKAVEAAAEENLIAVSTTTAPASTGAGEHSVAAGEKAIEVTYKVDPDSKVTRDNILFRKGSTDFADDASIQVVVQLAEALKSPTLASLKFVIEGHASAEGNAFSNQILSQQRSERIIGVLSNLGVDSNRLLPIGFGETQAKFPDFSEEALLRQDRRVVIYRLDN